jgi:hypothetical protein
MTQGNYWLKIHVLNPDVMDAVLIMQARKKQKGKSPDEVSSK